MEVEHYRSPGMAVTLGFSSSGRFGRLKTAGRRQYLVGR